MYCMYTYKYTLKSDQLQPTAQPSTAQPCAALHCTALHCTAQQSTSHSHPQQNIKGINPEWAAFAKYSQHRQWSPYLTLQICR